MILKLPDDVLDFIIQMEIGSKNDLTRDDMLPMFSGHHPACFDNGGRGMPFSFSKDHLISMDTVLEKLKVGAMS